MEQSKCKFQNAHYKPGRFVIVSFAFFILHCAFATASLAVPETNEARITDVTASSFSLVWMTDVAADPGIEVYADSSMTQPVTDGLIITPMPAGSSAAAQAARTKGVMKVMVSGTPPATTYYARAVTKDAANPDSVSYSGLQKVTTASTISLYRAVNNTTQGLANDLMAFPVYVRPADQSDQPRLGDLVIFEGLGTPYPISAFVGDGALSPEGILDLNNLFGTDGSNLIVTGGETVTLRVYRAGGLSTLTHYRRAPRNSSVVSVVSPVTGYYADINLDGKVDDQDFAEFKIHYRTAPNDSNYNPDFNFTNDPQAGIDVRSFGKFSKEYGRTDVK